MRQKHILSVLLAALMLLSAFSCALTASAEDSFCTVTVQIAGAGTVSDGTNVSSGSWFVIEPQVGQSVTLTATPPAGYEVVFWRNMETNRLVSFESTYTFTAGSELYLLLEVGKDQATLTAENKHRVIYVTEGDNLLYSGDVAIGSTDYMSRIPDVFLYSGGRTWDGWDIEPEDVAADPGRVIVHPKYKDDVSYIVTKIIGSSSVTDSYPYNSDCVMTAPPSMNGKSFSYWVVPADEEDPNSTTDVISSVLRSYSFKVVMNITLKAVYGAPSVPPYVTRVMGDTPDFDNDSVAIHTERSVSNGYTVIENGILFSRVPVGSEEEFVLNSGNPDIKSGKSKYNTPAGIYSVVITNWYTDDPMTGGSYYPLLYARSYLIVRNNSTNVTSTIYSDIYCVDYINKDYHAPGWDNYDDPLG